MEGEPGVVSGTGRPEPGRTVEEVTGQERQHLFSWSGLEDQVRSHDRLSDARNSTDRRWNETTAASHTHDRDSFALRPLPPAVFGGG